MHPLSAAEQSNLVAKWRHFPAHVAAVVDQFGNESAVGSKRENVCEPEAVDPRFVVQPTRIDSQKHCEELPEIG